MYYRLRECKKTSGNRFTLKLNGPSYKLYGGGYDKL